MDHLLTELEAIMTGFWLTDLSNFSAFVFENTKDVNWVGFYLDDGRKLRLGPFQGKVACTEIEYSRGVCGRAYSDGKVTVVADVHEFPGHITCDPASRSEIVIPLIKEGNKIGVLDIDSPIKNRFSSKEVNLFEKAVSILLSKNPTISKLF